MILLDTNVISEPLRRSPEARVINWIDAQSLETLYLSAITVAELRFGIASLPVGKRRDELENSIESHQPPAEPEAWIYEPLKADYSSGHMT